MRWLRTYALLFGLILSAGAALAAKAPEPSGTDPHIQSIEYNPDQVVLLRGVLSYQLMLEFGPGERLENVSIGDATAWQVTPNKKSDLLFLKPLSQRPNTNMTVVTNMRRYAFELQISKASEIGKIPYVVRFVYPQTESAKSAAPIPEGPPVIANKNYRVKGSPETTPVSVFDDGKATYFTWGPDAAAPAIFAVAGDGSESLVNYAVRGDYTIVQQIAPRFILRNGKQKAIVTNQKFPKLSSQRYQAPRAIPGGGVRMDRN